MGFKDWADKAKKTTADFSKSVNEKWQGSKAKEKMSDMGKQASEKASEAGRKAKQGFSEISKKPAKEHMDTAKQKYQEAKEMAAELKDQIKDMNREEAIEFMRYTYQGMSRTEAIKMVTAVVVPGGMPMYLALKLRQYKIDKNNIDAPKPNTPDSPDTDIPANQNVPKP